MTVSTFAIYFCSEPPDSEWDKKGVHAVNAYKSWLKKAQVIKNSGFRVICTNMIGNSDQFPTILVTYEALEEINLK